MQYGFIIDNRKCIGCHACTTACKSEHQVPLGVNRTWVKQVEKGTFPHTRRLFSVMRCNHCSDAPCVEICPVEALFIRSDGIVDFDKRRCIGCKSCMQACPYDALYIDPDTHTAAKCNYCAHRIDIGLEPACVNVCPEHAIISGDLDNPESEISMLLGSHEVSVRKEEKGTHPNLFYINGDEASLDPGQNARSPVYVWSEQTRGVGHYARAAERYAWSNDDVVHALMSNGTSDGGPDNHPKRSIDVLTKERPVSHRVYDTPDKGILWGWEVPAYLWTKAISAGVFVLYFILSMSGHVDRLQGIWCLGLSIGFLMLTGVFLVKDLDRPDRFVNVLLRPQWRSWLTRGGYAITAFGGLLTVQLLAVVFGWTVVSNVTGVINFPVALLVAIYTAFLFAQARGRDLWQSRVLPLHMLVHSMMAGASMLVMLQPIVHFGINAMIITGKVLIVSLFANLIILIIEVLGRHSSDDTHRTMTMILKGRYALRFWGLVVVAGNILPLFLLISGGGPEIMVLAAALFLLGIYINNAIWVEAPQRIALA